MKALTIWQPWAQLIAWGEKRYETRGWATRYRGLLAIHAANKPITPDTARAEGAYTVEALARHGCNDVQELPLGAVVCVCRLVAVHTTFHLNLRHYAGSITLTPQERAFGDFSEGRYAWELEVVEVFEQPIQVKGNQGLWEWKR